MFLNTITNWLRGGENTQPRRTARAGLRLEHLEERTVLSWTAVPSTFQWPASTDVSFVSNANAGAGTITNNEVDMYNFVAPRTGTYTVNAGKLFSQVDTVAGLFQMDGNRVAGNDDFNGTDSQFTAYLVAGTRYALAVTNYTGTSTGGYKWSIQGPPLSVEANYHYNSDIRTWGRGSLTGNTLQVEMQSFNYTNWNIYDHRVSVYLLDQSGSPIHTGSWSLTKRTYGLFVPGGPGVRMDSYSWDLSGWDLRNVASMRIVVS
jgi:hypothetical protein